VLLAFVATVVPADSLLPCVPPPLDEDESPASDDALAQATMTSDASSHVRMTTSMHVRSAIRDEKRRGRQAPPSFSITDAGASVHGRRMRRLSCVTALAIVACGDAPADAQGEATSTESGESGSTTSSSTATTTATTGATTTAADTTTDASSSSSSEDTGHVVTPCDGVAAPGTWEHITPAEVNLAADFETPAGENYGVHSFVIDPQDTATIYLGTSAQGIWKSSDCGATWMHIDTGTNADTIDGGRQWTFVIDPIDPQMLYTNTGYGAFGAWKSTNGGVDWEPFVDDAHLAVLQFGGFVQYIRMDATDSQHLLVTPHFECEVGALDGLPMTPACMLETMDAGETWSILEGTPPAGEGITQKMIDADTWFWGEGFGGLWRTGNGGESWEHVYDGGYATAAIFPIAGGYVTGGVFSTLQSTDGIAWTSIEGSPGTEFFAGDDQTVYASRNGYYSSASTADPTTWTELPMPEFPYPDYIVTWDLQYDPDHQLLYSLNSRNGFWRFHTG
jgi:hypothetical protein